VRFALGYSALVRAMSSPFVGQVILADVPIAADRGVGALETV
jgi:hypothetical protein